MLNRNGRLFTFGCSFTSWCWPTWADILGSQFAYYENWGQSGAGNLFISNSVTECSLRNKLTPNDTVIVMWSTVNREDQYFNHTWNLRGPDVTYPNFDSRGYLINNLSLIKNTKHLLDSSGVNYRFYSLVPFFSTLPVYKPGHFTNWKHYYNSSTQLHNQEQDVFLVYQETIDTICAAFTDLVPLTEKTIPTTRKLREIKEQYTNNHYDLLLDKNYSIFNGSDWPGLEKIKNNEFKNTPKHVMTEIAKMQHITNREIRVRANDRFRISKSERKLGEWHPGPLEHLEFLKLTKLVDSVDRDALGELALWTSKINKFGKFACDFMPNYTNAPAARL